MAVLAGKNCPAKHQFRTVLFVGYSERLSNMCSLVCIELVDAVKEPAFLSNQYYFYSRWINRLYLSDFIPVYPPMDPLVVLSIYFLLQHTVRIYRDLHRRIRFFASISTTLVKSCCPAGDLLAEDRSEARAAPMAKMTAGDEETKSGRWCSTRPKTSSPTGSSWWSVRALTPAISATWCTVYTITLR